MDDDRTSTISFLTGSGEELKQDLAAAVYETLEHLQTEHGAVRRSAGNAGGDSTAEEHAASRAPRANGRRGNA